MNLKDSDDPDDFKNLLVQLGYTREFWELGLKIDDYISRVNLSKLPFKFTLSKRRWGNTLAWAIILEAHVQDVENVDEKVVGTASLPFLISDNHDLKFETFTDKSRTAIHAIMLHEADECLVIDNARPFNPHKEKNNGPVPEAAG